MTIRIRATYSMNIYEEDLKEYARDNDYDWQDIDQLEIIDAFSPSIYGELVDWSVESV